MFEKEGCFDGDMSIERKIQSVPDILIKFMISLADEGMSIIYKIGSWKFVKSYQMKFVLSTRKKELYAHLIFKTMYSSLLALII